ncbi:MAG: hypothetical protein HY290_07500 [Planctomycetia bacterium]|nr:hypothetical protein [Planctomycetia bacterium]
MTRTSQTVAGLLITALIAGIVICAQAAEPAKKAQPTSGKATGGKRTAKSATVEKSDEGEKSTGPVEPVNPGVFLLRDPLVQAELKLTAAQKAAAAELAVEFNESIWRFRDASIESDVARKEARIVNAQIEPRLAELLNAGQRARLAGIALQVQGTEALSYSSTVEQLALTREQQEKIARLTAAAHAAIKKLNEQSVGSKDLAELNSKSAKLQTGLQRDLVAVLSKTQRGRWTDLRGAPVDLARLQPLTAQAPELRGVDAWINSEPTTFKELRGKVVVLHFWTFG